MLQYVKDINAAVQGLGIVATNQGPLIRMLIRNWPLTVAMGGALGLKLYDRYKNKDLSLYTGLVDSGAIVGPVVSIMSLAYLARINEEKQPQLALPAPPARQPSYAPSGAQMQPAPFPQPV